MIAAVLSFVFALLPVPPLTGPVVDRAGVLSRGDVQRLDDLARGALAAQDGQGPQLGFLIVPSLEGEPIEDYSIRVAEAWKLGTAAKDNGLLFVVSTGDRKVRIEVGGGLEGEITDAQSSRIIREIIAPAFRQGDIGGGLYLGAQQALAYAGVEAGERVAHPQRGERHGVPLVVLLFFLLFFVLGGLGGRRRRGFWIGGGGFGGPFGGGGFGGGRGGGGWGGGGGGFSGGGSSGSW